MNNSDTFSTLLDDQEDVNNEDEETGSVFDNFLEEFEILNQTDEKKTNDINSDFFDLNKLNDSNTNEIRNTEKDLLLSKLDEKENEIKVLNEAICELDEGLEKVTKEKKTLENELMEARETMSSYQSRLDEYRILLDNSKKIELESRNTNDMLMMKLESSRSLNNVKSEDNEMFMNHEGKNSVNMHDIGRQMSELCKIKEENSLLRSKVDLLTLDCDALKVTVDSQSQELCQNNDEIDELLKTINQLNKQINESRDRDDEIAILRKNIDDEVLAKESLQKELEFFKNLDNENKRVISEQSDEIRDLNGLVKSLSDEKSSIFQELLDSKNNEEYVKQLENKVKTLEDEIQITNSSYKDLQLVLDEKTKTISMLSTQHMENEDRTSELENLIKTKDDIINQKIEQIRVLEDNLSNLEDSFRCKESEFASLRQESIMNSDLTGLQDLIDQKTQENKELELSLTELRQLLSEKEVEISRLNSQIIDADGIGFENKEIKSNNDGSEDEIVYLSNKLESKKEEVQSLKQRIDDLVSANELKEAELTELQNKFDMVKDEVNQKEATILEARDEKTVTMLETNIRTLNEENSRLKESVMILEEQVRETESELLNARSTISLFNESTMGLENSSALKSEVDVLREEIQQKDQQILMLNNRLEDSMNSNQFAEHEEKIKELESLNEKLRDDIEEVEDENRILNDKISSLTSQISQSFQSGAQTEEVNDLKSMIERLSKENNELKEKANVGNNYDEEILRYKKAVTVLKKQIEALKEAQNTLAKEKDDLMNQNSLLNEKLTAKNQETNDLKVTLTDMKEQILELSNKEEDYIILKKQVENMEHELSEKSRMQIVIDENEGLIRSLRNELELHKNKLEELEKSHANTMEGRGDNQDSNPDIMRYKKALLGLKKQNETYKQIINDLKMKLSSTNENQDELIEKLQRENEELMSEVAHIKAEYNNFYANHDIEIKKFKQQIETLNQENEKVKSEMESQNTTNNNTINLLQDQLIQRDTKIGELSSEIVSLRNNPQSVGSSDEIARYKKALAVLKKRVESLEQKNAQLFNENARIKSSSESLNHAELNKDEEFMRIDKYIKKIDYLNDVLTQMKNSNEKLAKENEQYVSVISEFKSKHGNAHKEQVSYYVNENETLNNQIQSLKCEINNLKTELADCAIKIEDSNSELQNKTNLILSLEKENESLKEQIESISSKIVSSDQGETCYNSHSDKEFDDLKSLLKQKDDEIAKIKSHISDDSQIGVLKDLVQSKDAEITSLQDRINKLEEEILVRVDVPPINESNNVQFQLEKCRMEYEKLKKESSKKISDLSQQLMDIGQQQGNNDEVVKLKKAVAILKKQLHEKNQELQDLSSKSQLNFDPTEVQKLKNLLREKDDEISALKEENDALSAELEEGFEKSTSIGNDREIQKLKTEINNLISVNLQLQSDLTKAKEQSSEREDVSNFKEQMKQVDIIHQNEVDVLNLTINSLKKQLEEEAKSRNNMISSLDDNTLSVLKAEIEDKDKQISVLNKKVESLKSKLVKGSQLAQNDTISAINMHVTDDVVDYDKLVVELSELKEKYEETKDALIIQKRLNEEKDKLIMTPKNDHYEKELAEKQEEIIKLNEKIAALQTDIDDVESKNSILISENSMLQSESQTLQEKIRNLELLSNSYVDKDEFFKVSTENDSLRQQNDEIKKTLKNYEDMIEELNKDKSQIREEYLNQIDKLNDTITKLKDDSARSCEDDQVGIHKVSESQLYHEDGGQIDALKRQEEIIKSKDDDIRSLLEEINSLQEETNRVKDACEEEVLKLKKEYTAQEDEYINYQMDSQEIIESKDNTIKSLQQELDKYKSMLAMTNNSSKEIIQSNSADMDEGMISAHQDKPKEYPDQSNKLNIINSDDEREILELKQQLTNHDNTFINDNSLLIEQYVIDINIKEEIIKKLRAENGALSDSLTSLQDALDKHFIYDDSEDSEDLKKRINYMQERLKCINNENQELHVQLEFYKKQEAMYSESACINAELSEQLELAKKEVELAKIESQAQVDQKLLEAEKEINNLRIKLKELQSPLGTDDISLETSKNGDDTEFDDGYIRSDTDIRLPYLKSTIIQFLTQDIRTQESLVPVILEFLDIEYSERDNVKNKWLENNSLIKGVQKTM